jgi:ribosome-associated toxin RatA of RatAB toxin-antitoxin module
MKGLSEGESPWRAGGRSGKKEGRMKRKKVLIPVLVLAAAVMGLFVLWMQRKAVEREVLVPQEVVRQPVPSAGAPSGDLVSEELKEEGRNFQLHLVAEIRADPRMVYATLVDFEHLKELIPDCTQLDVVESSGNKRVVYMKRFILFMGKEMGGNVEYTLYPEEMKFEMKTLRDPNANLTEKWVIEPAGDKTHVVYHADVAPKLKVPIFMAQAWIKENFVDLMKAVKGRLETQPASE